MLHVQEYLQHHSLEELQEEHNIKVVHHETLPLVILNYDQIESTKTNPLVMECRSLVLEKDTWVVVAKSFDRFFNLGEALEITDKFDWTDFDGFAKEDGSLITMFFYADHWRIVTKGSFAGGKIGHEDFTWAHLFWSTLYKYPIDIANMNKNHSFVFELCSTSNKIVRLYDVPQLFLLAIFDTTHMQELPMVNMYRYCEHMPTVDYLEFANLKDVDLYIKDLEENDPTNEGVVLKDCNGLRLKIKNRKYLSLHHIKGEGDNLFNPKHLLPWVMSGDDEILVYFPEVEKKHKQMKDDVDMEWENLKNLYDDVKDIKERKEIALAIKDCRFKSLIFTKLNSEDSLHDIWLKSEKLIYKVMYK